MVVDEVAHMLLHMVFDMVAGMVADMATNKKRKLIFLFLADMLLHMGADKVAGMVAVMADQALTRFLISRKSREEMVHYFLSRAGELNFHFSRCSRMSRF